MYDLGESFKVDLNNALMNPECVFKGSKYRITILTERTLRLEYSTNGIFEDRPTELVLNRNFEKPEFNVIENDRELKITTKYFELYYLKEMPFAGTKLSPTKNLKVTLLGTKKAWYYNHPEARNLGYISNRENKKLVNKKGLFSLDGFVSIDDSKSSIIESNGSYKLRENNNIDTYLFMYDKDYYYCLNDYFMLTGFPALIPRYALGVWWNKDEFYSIEDLRHFINKFISTNIPISVFLLNHWDNDLTFKNDYNNPKVLFESFNRKNIRLGLSLSLNDYFKQSTDVFNKLSKYLSTDKNGNIPFNIFDERTIDAFFKLIIHPLSNLGVGLYSLNNTNKNKVDVLRNYLYKDQLNYKIRPLVSTYNGNYASHRYPVTYTGKSSVNWDSIKEILKFNLSASNMGISFLSHDFGGTSGGIEDNEIYTRSIQLGTFSPVLRLGSDSGKYYKREPWKWDLKTAKITTDYLNLRYRLMPYLYTESYKYYKYGMPLVEPLYHTHLGLYDNELYSNEYLLGSNFLICPITEKKEVIMDRVIKKVYIPDGVWYDFFTGKKYVGNKKYVSFYKDEEYPVFVKAGTIVPMSLNKYNDISNPKGMEIQVFPGANNTYSIYEDDGVTNEYLNKEYLITNVEFVSEKDNYKVTILPVDGKTSVVPKTRNYIIRFKNTKGNVKVSSYSENKEIPNIVHTKSNDLLVELKDVRTDMQTTIVCTGNDIEIDAMRIINEDIVSIISDLPIKTVLKHKIDEIMFSNKYSIKRKRIEIRKLAHTKDYLEKKYIDLFLKLLEYINEV